MQQEKIFAPDGHDDQYFGYSVSISNDYAIVGAYKDNDEALDAGLRIYVRSGTTWTQQIRLSLRIHKPNIVLVIAFLSMATTLLWELLESLFLSLLLDQGIQVRIYSKEWTTWEEQKTYIISEPVDYLFVGYMYGDYIVVVLMEVIGTLIQTHHLIRV